MVDVDATVVSIQKNHIVCKLYVQKNITPSTVNRSLFIIINNRENGHQILARNPKSFVKIGSIVTFADIAAKQLQSTSLHKIIRVRYDL